jgi:hypothetical protein
MPEEPTTPDLEEAIRRLVEVGNRRPPPDYDAALAIYSRDAVVDTTPLGLGSFEGREAVRGFFEDWIAAYEHMEQALGRSARSSGFVERARRGHARSSGWLPSYRAQSRP